MENKIFDYIEITYDKLTNQLERWLKETYQLSSKVFSHASPSGMIMHVQKLLFSWNMLYLKNSLSQLDIQTCNNTRVIRSQARISGHNPIRSISAIGTLRMRLKVGVNYRDKIKGSKIIVQNNTLLKNKSNNLYYTITVGESSRNVYDILPNTDIYFSVRQGKYEDQTYTGTGYKGQSISVVVNREQIIDNFSYSIYYNGINLKVVDGMYDMLPNEYACYTRTGFEGGLDIYFGNGDFGFIPEIGSEIKVAYLLTDGSDGNILTNLINDFTFEDDVTDSDGNILNMENLFDIFIHNDINFGVDGETIEYTRSVIPYVSRNFVLATPEQFVYHLKRLNMYSKVNAFNMLDETDINNNKYIDSFVKETFGSNVNVNVIKDKMKKYFPTIYDNQIYIYLIPKVSNYFVGDYNYFNVPFDVFYLDDDEKEKALDYLKRMGIISITTNVVIIQPTISLYVANIYIRQYNKIDTQDNIRNKVINLVSDYFINNERFDRIVKSDIIKKIKNEIEAIDSINIEFVCKKNEDYHREGTKNQQGDYNDFTNPWDPKRQQPSNYNVLEDQISIIKDRKVYIKTQYNPDAILGIDGVQGDIVVEKDELPVLRGGWYDRNGVYYSEVPDPKGLSSINIIWTGTNDKKTTWQTTSSPTSQGQLVQPIKVKETKTPYLSTK